jgi:hypothetical protein
LNQKDWEFGGWCCGLCIGRKRSRLPIDILDRGFVIVDDNTDLEAMQKKFPPISPTGKKQVVSPSSQRSLLKNKKTEKKWIIQQTKELLPIEDTSNTFFGNDILMLILSEGLNIFYVVCRRFVQRRLGS